MILNGSKTKSMLISASNKHQLTTNFSLTLLDDSLQTTSTEKLLGVTFDHNLNFKSHVEIKLRKCNSLLFLLMRIKCFLDLKTRKLFYNAYILPHLDYCITVWGNSSNQLMDQLLKFQKRAARIILDENFDSPSAPLFLALKWMTIYERLEYKQAILVYKSLTQNSPTYLASKLQKVQYTERQLRSSSNDLLLVPQPKLEIFRKSISYAGPKLWNSLPANIRHTDSVASFKTLYIKFKFPTWTTSQ